MTVWTPPRWSPADLVPGRIFARRGFAMSFAEAASRGGAMGREWRDIAGPAPAVDAAPGGYVLLGGAGLLGSRIAAALLGEVSDAPVTLVSRGPRSVERLWSAWLGEDAAAALMASPRLRFVNADLSGDGMDWMREIPRCGTVFHLVAQLDAFAGWGAEIRTNIGSLIHAVALARRDGALLQYASTLSLQVSSNWEPTSDEDPEAPAPVRDDLWLYGGYAQTKAAGEFALAVAAPDLAVQTVRYGLLVAEGGVPFPDGHFVPGLVQALLQVGALPATAEDARVDLTPTDNAAGAAVAMARTGEARVFHWANATGARLEGLVAALQVELARRRQPDLEEVGDEEWDRRVTALPGLPRTLLRAAFRKSEFLASREVSDRPMFNADLCQATGRRFAVGFAGHPLPLRPGKLMMGIVRSALRTSSLPVRVGAFSERRTA